MPKQKGYVQSRTNNIPGRSNSAVADLSHSSEVAEEENGHEVTTTPPLISQSAPETSVELDDDCQSSHSSDDLIEMLEVDEPESDQKSFATKMMAYFLEWTRKTRKENAEWKRPHKNLGNAPRTIPHHKKLSKDTTTKNKSVLTDFWSRPTKKARVEVAPVLVNMEVMDEAAMESINGHTMETSEVERDFVVQEGGWEPSSAPEEVAAEALEDTQDVQEEEEEEEEDSAAAPEPSPEGVAVSQPGTQSATQPAEMQPIMVLHPNNTEGEDPDDLQRDLWANRGKMKAVGKAIDRMAKTRHKELNKVLNTRVTGMITLINFYTSEVEVLTWRRASLLAARAAGRGISLARNLRRWILAYARGNCAWSALPHTRYAKFDTTFLHDEDLSQRIRQHLQSLGRDFKAQDVVNFISSDSMQACIGTCRKKVSLTTAQRWLKENHRYGHPTKGMYIDGHERADVTMCRVGFLQRMEERARRMPIYNTKKGEESTDMPTLQPHEKLLILVTHDESTFYENDRNRRRWISSTETPTPQPKGEGGSVMVSDFLSPTFGRLADSDGEARVFFHCGKNRDGYFNNDNVLDQTEKAINVFERMHPGAQALFLFDNAPTHKKRAPDALSAKHMPKSCKEWRPGQARMRDATLPDGDPQPLYWPDNHPEYPGYFKGMEQILRERGLWQDKLRAQCTERFADCEDKQECCCRRILYNQPDFVDQMSCLEELIDDRGHLCDFYPKFHCELNFIEQYWGAAKFRYRVTPPTRNVALMEENMRQCLDDVPLIQVQRYWNRSLRFMDAYRKGLNGAQAIWANKRYHGHRTLPATIMKEIERQGIA